MTLTESFTALINTPSAFKVVGVKKSAFHNLKTRFLNGNIIKESTMREYVKRSGMFEYKPECWELMNLM